jgi:murein DD-endopeptidase MepM/ murein hydrolase activator NlpD
MLSAPIDGPFRVSSGYLDERDCSVCSRTHHGIDLVAAPGTPIVASGPGTVERADFSDSYGNVVIIDHGNLSTLYAHLEGFAKGITEGVRVRRGQVVGYLGSTGKSTGPHLHFEVVAAKPAEAGFYSVAAKRDPQKYVSGFPGSALQSVVIAACALVLLLLVLSMSGAR